jgi:hypothetical protein
MIWNLDACLACNATLPESGPSPESQVQHEWTIVLSTQHPGACSRSMTQHDTALQGQHCLPNPYGRVLLIVLVPHAAASYARQKPNKTVTCMTATWGTAALSTAGTQCQNPQSPGVAWLVLLQ